MKGITTQLKQSRCLLLVATCLAIGGLISQPGAVSAAGKGSPAPTQNAQAGRLVIVRSASLGPTIVGLKIDGKEAARISYNRRYDEPIAAGPHTLTVYPAISLGGAKPTEKHLNVQPGKTYTFTAARKDIQIVLK